LWNDEYYSVLNSVQAISYPSILSGGIKEGNNSPLFYALLKIQCDLFSYQVPKEWRLGHWRGVFVFDQVFLRIQSVFWMSTALAALFYYFSRMYSFWIGAYAVALMISTGGFWGHWTEARPYSLWTALSILQIIILLNNWQSSGKPQNRGVWGLVIIHWFLALITVISCVQILAAGIILSFGRRFSFREHLVLFLIPFGICGFYYTHAPHYLFYFLDGPMSLINANVPKDWWILIITGFVIFLFQPKPKNWQLMLEMKYLSFFGVILILFLLILLRLSMYESKVSSAFQISNRYFLSLNPVGGVAVVIFSKYIVSVFKWKPVRILIVSILAGLLIFHLHKVISI